MNLRPGQVSALDHLVKQKQDVILIAKTSFGKSLIFQYAPLLFKKNEQPGIALILMPLTLLQEEQAEKTRARLGAFGARCIVLNAVTDSANSRRAIAQGGYTHGKYLFLLFSLS